LIKPWQAPLNKAPNKEGGKGRANKERENPNPSRSHKSKTQTGSYTRGTGTKDVHIMTKEFPHMSQLKSSELVGGVSFWVFRTPLYYTLFR
jgi:hypothetical protein